MEKALSHALLDLTRPEAQVFDMLTAEACSVATICQKTGLERMKVERLVTRLHRRGIIRKVPVGKRTHWKRASLSSLQRRLDALRHTLITNDEELREATKPKEVYIHDTADIKIIQGTKQLLEIFAHVYKTQGSKRVFLTQFPSAMRALTNSTEGLDYLLYVNRIANQTKGIAELFASQDTTVIWNEVASYESLSQHISQRLVDASLLPEEYVPSDLPAELFIFDDMAMLTDWATETGIIIHNKNIVRMLKIFFRATREHGRQFNPNKIFQEQSTPDA